MHQRLGYELDLRSEEGTVITLRFTAQMTRKAVSPNRDPGTYPRCFSEGTIRCPSPALKTWACRREMS